MRSESTRVAATVAVSENGVIGVDGGLPWELPRDLAHFKTVTMGSPIVMGRRTFESIGRVLPGRLNIILSRNSEPKSDANGAEWFPNLDEALTFASATKSETGEIHIIGGEKVFADGFSRHLIDRLYLTRVAAHVEGDTHLVGIDFSDWELVSSTVHKADEHNCFDMTFEIYDRRQIPSSD